MLYSLEDQLLFLIQVYSEGLDVPVVSNLASAWRHEGTMTSQGSRIVYITEKSVRKHAQSTTFGLSPRLACSG